MLDSSSLQLKSAHVFCRAPDKQLSVQVQFDLVYVFSYFCTKWLLSGLRLGLNCSYLSSNTHPFVFIINNIYSIKNEGVNSMSKFIFHIKLHG